MERLKTEHNKKKRQRRFKEAELDEATVSPTVGVMTRSKAKGISPSPCSPVKAPGSKKRITSPKPKKNPWAKKLEEPNNIEERRKMKASLLEKAEKVRALRVHVE